MQFAHVYHAAATSFLSRLHPAQFGSTRRPSGGTPPRPTRAPTVGSGPQRGSDAHFDAVMGRSADLLARTAPSASVQSARQVGTDFHSANATADAAQVAGAHTDVDSIFNSRKAEVHRAFHPLPGQSNVTTSTASAASAPRTASRSTQGTLFPRKAVASPGAAKKTASPAPAARGSRTGPRAAQMGLFPRSAGKASD